MLTVGLIRLREQCSEANLQGKGHAQRRDKDGLPGWGLDTSFQEEHLSPRTCGRAWAFLFAYKCRAYLVSMCMCLHVCFFFFSSTFYVKCTYLTEGFTLLWEQCQNGELVLRCLRTSYGQYACYCTLGSKQKGALLFLGLKWAEKAISFTGIVT